MVFGQTKTHTDLELGVRWLHWRQCSGFQIFAQGRKTVRSIRNVQPRRSIHAV